MGRPTGRSTRRWYTPSANRALILCALVLAGCTGEGERPLPQGRSLKPALPGAFRSFPHPPGDGFVALVAIMRNVSSETIVLQAARLEGPAGIGTVVRAEGVEVAPLAATQDSLSVVPGGIYETYPPVFRDGDKNSPCHKQVLRPIDGYRLEPQEEALLAVRVRALAVGEFDVRRHVVTYQAAGSLVQQTIETGIKGEVAVGADPKVDPAESSCVQEEDAQFY